MVKQVISGHVADERDLWTAFNDNVSTGDRVFRTKTGYTIVSEDHSEDVDGDALGPIDDWYE